MPEELISNTAQRTNPIRVKLERRYVEFQSSPVSFSAVKVQERSAISAATHRVAFLTKLLAFKRHLFVNLDTVDIFAFVWETSTRRTKNNF